MHARLLAVPWYGLAAFAIVAAAQPTPGYDSAYADYKPYIDAPPAPWREANDLAARVGGHAGIFAGSTHGHDAPPPDPAPARQEAAPATPGKPPHDAHH